MFENRKYVIFNTNETGSLQFHVPATYDETGSLLTEATSSDVMETSVSTLRSVSYTHLTLPTKA